MVPADEIPEQCDKRRRKLGRERGRPWSREEPPIITASTVAERRRAAGAPPTWCAPIWPLSATPPILSANRGHVSLGQLKASRNHL
jgi:hypothetical protein